MSNKVITLIPRKPGTTRAAFKDYYENNHAPLGTRYFPFDKYVRNHLVASHPEDLGFDVLMESWLDHGKAMAILTGEIERIFAEDEARFMDAPPRPEGITLKEHLVSGPPRGVDPRGIRKLAWFLASNGLEPETFLKAAHHWAAAMGEAAGASRVTLDEVIPGHASPYFKGDAIVTLWVARDVPAPAVTLPVGLAVQAMLTLDSHETTPEELRANLGKR